jgi:hypothetical protein
MKSSLLVILLLFNFPVNAQNLIPNGDFELDKYAYSKDFSNFEIVENWTIINGTPDVFCEKFGKKVDIPENMMGTEFACRGNSYAGLILLPVQKEFHQEIIQCKLITPLKKDIQYTFILFYSVPENSGYIGDSINFLFSKKPLRNSKQIENYLPRHGAGLMNKPIGWTKIKYDFIAKGGESYLTICRANKNYEYKKNHICPKRLN